MDNITHFVVGLGLGALIDRSLPAEANPLHGRTRTRMLLTIGCLASNFPDLDLLLTRLTETPLGYLLQHRGHTHTVLGALGEAALLLGLVYVLWPAARHLLRASRRVRWAALGTACVGLALHIAMDGLNVYGVHPFWPFDARWYYGDMVFIVEPVFWVAFGVPLAAMVAGRRRRRLMLALLAAVPLAATVLGFLQWGSLAALLALGLLLAWIERRGGPAPQRARERTALASGLAVSLAFVAVQATALHAARTAVAAAIARSDPGERLRDAALSAYPANPLCWSVVTVATDAGGVNYHLRRGLLSIAPGITQAGACPAGIAGRATGTRAGNGDLEHDGNGGNGAQLAWQSEERDSLAALRTLTATNCHFNAWMRFARAPSVGPAEATDARWGPSGSRNFSTIDYAGLAQSPCPHAIPDWGTPRADLLRKPIATSRKINTFVEK
jgi:inner membrane protein